MKVKEILNLLETKMSPSVIASTDVTGQPHARFIHIGLANEKGIFFMTSPTTRFYNQLQANPNIAITGMYQEEYLIQVIRIEGKIRELGEEKLEEVLAGNAFVEQVYPDHKERENVRVFQLYEGKGFYQSLTQGHKYTFDIKGDLAKED
ncbi:pyridoxamine 5'-phosphate oxidase family protein [Streptococcus thoraltensis]|uniref:pyridoxamine 5'-phosphate oxidase family protein n=1 Tax=Streptococcus thoraltensis TaxID=55085 RepID=UPI00036654B2|nr:pyridoxamine 5'-phosphate oxidase family protein [Streptococcus thoraltensis]MDY4762063.1 pyridoxamine 5'-phosphate oxidase family protein [Streptococcus thoraltensis]